MKPSVLALSLAVAFATSAVHAVDAVPSAAAKPGGEATEGSRNKQPQVQDLSAISVSGALDQARNALSPDTGSSQYVIDRHTHSAGP